MRREVHTHSTTVGSAGDLVVLKLEVGIEDRGIELSLAVEAVADQLPVMCWSFHLHLPLLSSCHNSVVIRDVVRKNDFPCRQL